MLKNFRANVLKYVSVKIIEFVAAFVENLLRQAWSQLADFSIVEMHKIFMFFVLLSFFRPLFNTEGELDSSEISFDFSFQVGSLFVVAVV